MSTSNENAHAQHLEHRQDHFRWREEHLHALAVLKRAEAEILSHEARILAHEAEIERHEEQIAHGDDHAPAPDADEHARFAHTHHGHDDHHQALLEAIKAIEAQLDRHA